MPPSVAPMIRPRLAMPSRRRTLLLCTALQAAGMVALPVAFAPARAQPAPNARPMGGVVVGGAAAIRRSAGATTIDQASQRAAIDWQSFDVGANQRVDFHQPNAAAVALNRVTGPNPSQIAGQINANGQVILENQDGITFSQGAQINTAGFIATAAGITNQNFMAGHMVFDQPAAPNAAVVNHGQITVRDAGIAALVAPQVANSGVIEARLGRVALAGAQTWALDLYGDGLVSIDVNGAVVHPPVGPYGKPVTALVTNTGTVIAAGGEIQLTAREAAGIVQNLVSAGGTLAAPTVGTQAGGTQTGQIVLNGIGGSIAVAGALLAQGTAPGTVGGAIEVAPSGGVTVAAGARIDASGAAGGGVLAIGTDLGRARGGPGTAPTRLASDVTIAAGASLAANATVKGDGGRVVLLSADQTVMDGAIAAHGGPAGGNGGFAEISGQVFGFGGALDLGAAFGDVGTVLFDPGTLEVIVGNNGAGSLDVSLSPGGTILSNAGTIYDTISNGAINQIGGTANVLLQASTLLTVDSGATISVAQGLTMQSGGDMTVGASISAASVELDAGGNFLLSGTVATLPSAGVTAATGNVVIRAGTVSAAGVMTLNGPVTSTNGAVFLSAGAGGITINQPVAADSSGAFSPSANGVISLQTDALSFGANGKLVTTLGGIEVAPRTPGLAMTVGATGAGLSVPTLPILANGGVTPNLLLGAVTDPNGGALAVTAGAITIAGSLYTIGFNFAQLTLLANGPVSQTAPLQAIGLLQGGAGQVSLMDPGNQIFTLGGFTTAGVFQLEDSVNLAVTGVVSAADILLAVGPANAGNLLTLGPAGAATLAVGQGGTISILTDNFANPYGFRGSTIIAPGGTVAIAPFTQGRAELFAEPPTGTLAAPGLLITAGDLASIQPGIATFRAGEIPGATGPTAGSIAFQEPVSLVGIANTLELDTTGPITQLSTATVAVNTLTGQAGSVVLDQGNFIDNLAAFADMGVFALTDLTALTIQGPLDPSSVAISSVGGMILAGNIVLPASGGPSVALTVAPGTAGTASFIQTGAVSVGGTAPNGGTLAIGLPATGGVAQFAGLSAPGMSVRLGLGNGTATGTIVARAFAVNGAGGSATLFGAVAGNATPTAALISTITPAVDPAYTFNDCVIEATFCTISQTNQTQNTATFGGLEPVLFPGPFLPELPQYSLQLLGLPLVAPDQLTDPDVIPANISDIDY